MALLAHVVCTVPEESTVTPVDDTHGVPVAFRSTQRTEDERREVELLVILRRGRPEVDELIIRTTQPGTPGSPLGAADLRGLSLPDLVRAAVHAARQPLSPDNVLVGPTFDDRTPGAPAPQREGRAYGLEHWRRVGEVYRSAKAARLNTQQAVLDELGASDLRTAARWIARANKLGLLAGGLNYYFRLEPETDDDATGETDARPHRSPFR